MIIGEFEQFIDLNADYCRDTIVYDASKLTFTYTIDVKNGTRILSDATHFGKHCPRSLSVRGKTDRLIFNYLHSISSVADDYMSVVYTGYYTPKDIKYRFVLKWQ
jgi:hypothetical protein